MDEKNVEVMMRQRAIEQAKYYEEGVKLSEYVHEEEEKAFQASKVMKDAEMKANVARQKIMQVLFFLI